MQRLFALIDMADTVVVDGYEIDEFAESPDGVGFSGPPCMRLTLCDEAWFFPGQDVELEDGCVQAADVDGNFCTVEFFVRVPLALPQP